MAEMRVECYAGFKADERPTRFLWRGHNFEVMEVEDKWYSPEATYFRVVIQDGDRFVLRHDKCQDIWTVDAFRATHGRLDSPEASEVGAG